MTSSRLRWAAASLLPAAAVAVALIAGGGSDREAQPDPAPAAPPSVAGGFSRSEYSNVFVLDVRTRKLDRLTANDDERFADFPAWSPAGALAYSQSPCEGCRARLFTSAADGSRIARVHARVANAFQPSWSPDGRRIAVASPGVGIYVVEQRTGETRRLTRGEADEAPAWSPDGKSILFHRQVSATNWDIYSVRPQGGHARRITRDGRQQLHPAWSADGRTVAIAEQHGSGNWVVVTMRPDGSGRRQLTDERHSSQDPAWSPDGARLAFVAQTGGHEAIGVIRSDGSERRLLTGRTLAVTAPAWSPDGRSIAFAAKHVAIGGGGH